MPGSRRRGGSRQFRAFARGPHGRRMPKAVRKALPDIAARATVAANHIATAKVCPHLQAINHSSGHSARAIAMNSRVKHQGASRRELPLAARNSPIDSAAQVRQSN